MLDGAYRIERNAESKKWWHVAEEETVLHFLRHVLVKLRARYVKAVVFEVGHKADDNFLRVEAGDAAECLRKIEEVSPFLPLIQRPQLRAEQFLGFVGKYVCLAAVPGAFDFESISNSGYSLKPPTKPKHFEPQRSAC